MRTLGSDDMTSIIKAIALIYFSNLNINDIIVETDGRSCQGISNIKKNLVRNGVGMSGNLYLDVVVQDFTGSWPKTGSFHSRDTIIVVF